MQTYPFIITWATTLTIVAARDIRGSCDASRPVEELDSGVMLLQSHHSLASSVKQHSTLASGADFWPFTRWNPNPAEAPPVILHIPEEEQVDIANVDIYYETRCPFSVELLNTSLREAWGFDDLRARLNVKLYPFGNAIIVPEENISEGYHFWHPDAAYPVVICQHDQSECFGNTIQACAIDLLQGQDQFVPYVLCVSSYGTLMGWEKSSYECGQKLGVNMSSVRECVQSERGLSLIKAMGNASMSAFRSSNASGVPLVFVQGNRTVNNTLLGPICSWLKAPRPAVCSSYVGNATGSKGGCGDKENASLC